MIEIKNLSKTYISKEKSFEALKDINLSIGHGDIFGIIGLSGAGKSTLVRCINMLERPTSGEIFIDGKDIVKVGAKELRSMRKNIGMIFQHFNLLMNSTVYDNIAFPLKISGYRREEIDKKVKKLLDVVDLEDKSNSYPSELSGGQKQRVGIARALANDPEIILCDEATSALDPNTTQSILELLKKINKKFNITIIIITHEMDVIKKICNKVAVLEQGSLVEEGDVVSVFSNPKTDILRSFLQENKYDIPENVLSTEKNKGIEEKVLRIDFIGARSKEPIISKMIKKFDVDVSILSGNIENIQDTNLGYLIIKICGKEESVTKSINYLKDINLRVEVI